MSDTSQGPGWWEASDNKWYPPELKPEVVLPPPPQMNPTLPTAATAAQVPSLPGGETEF
jgi:hypothetical protein